MVRELTTSSIPLHSVPYIAVYVKIALCQRVRYDEDYTPSTTNIAYLVDPMICKRTGKSVSYDGREC